MGSRQSLFFCWVFISNFISPLYCDDAYSYPRTPDRLPASVSRPRTRYNNRCSRVTVPNGSMVLKHRGRVAKFTCNSGYKLIGDNIATCYQRKWDAIPTCVKDVQCPKELPKVMNGRMIEFSYVYFKVICNDGYKLPDNGQSIYPCEEFFRPDVEPPVCQLSDALYCDFERDTCGWNNTVPYFSWIRYQNATPSHELHTGPGGDHTTGTGHYMYIEASGLPDNEEKYAKLTRVFKQVDSPEVCFVFWYHMYGFNIGTLDVYVDFNKVFSKSGNQGDKWRKGIIQRLPSDRDFYISIVATTANGFAGDIAIDDIGLVNSTYCTKTILIDTTCKNRCFEKEVNPKLCKCSSECLIEGTCCTDFMHYCSNDAYTSTATAETTEWETTTDGWEMSTNGVEGLGDSSATESVIGGGGSSEMYVGSTSESDGSLLRDQSTEAGGLVTDQLMSTEETASERARESGSTLVMEYRDLDEWKSSTERGPRASKTPSVRLEPDGEGESWPSTQEEPEGVSSRWPSTLQELESVSTKRLLIDQPDEVTSRPAGASTRSTLVTHTTEPVIHSEQTHVESRVADINEEFLTSEVSEITAPPSTAEPTTQLHTQIAPQREPNSAITRTATSPSTVSELFVTLQPQATSPSTADQQETKPSTSPSTHPENHSTTTWRTHLQENDYDDFYEPVATQGHRQQIHPVTTPAADVVTSGITRKPFKWKKTYVPKGRYTFSAVKSENRTTAYVSVVVGVAAFLTAVVAAAYIFRRRRAIRFRDTTEESDVLYMTSDEMLDFNIARRTTPAHPGQSSSSQPNTRACQSDFSFCSTNRS